MSDPSWVKYEREEREALENAAFIVWVDYGYDGWHPTPHADWDSAIRDARSYGPNVITKGAIRIKEPA